MDSLKIILTSTVISSIISTFFSFLQNRKNANLQHITNERKEWRKEIRDIAEEINSKNMDDINNTIAKLKVRLNPYGYWGDDYTSDSHIWKVIFELENPQSAEFEINKLLLIDYLSLLLKDDWERSKLEIKGDRFNSFKIALYFLMSLLFSYNYFYTWNMNKELNYFFSMFLICSCILIVPSVGYGSVYRKDNNRYLKNIKEFNKEFKIKLLKRIIPYFIILLFDLVYIFRTASIDFTDYAYSLSYILIFMFLFFALSIINSKQIYLKNCSYILSIYTCELKRKEKLMERSN